MKEGKGATGDTFGEKNFSYFKKYLDYKWFQYIIIGTFIDGMIERQRKEAIKTYSEDNNISVKKAIELFDGIRDLRVQDVTDKAASFEDKIRLKIMLLNNQQNKLKKKMKQEIN